MIGCIGLGRMGGPVCRNLARRGDGDVLAFDVSAAAMRACAAAGARPAAAIADLAAAADVIFTSLPMPADVEAVALGPDGIAAHARPGTVHFDLSTSSPAVARRVAAALGERAIEFLDAPVSGGPAGADAGTLTLMVGGDAATLDAHRDVLSAFAATVVHVGPVGSGLIVKLVNNLLLFAGVAAACEGLALGAAAGLERGKLDAAVRAATGDSLAYRAVADRARSGDYSASFTLDIGYKDVRLALQLADELGVPAPVGAGVHNLMRVARGMGFGAADPTVMLRVYETLNAPGTTRR